MKELSKNVRFHAITPQLLQCETADGTTFFVAHENGTQSLPGNGGMRVKTYSSMGEAALECRHLSEVMAHKHAVYHTGFTGAKLVAVGDPQRINKTLLLEAVADVLNHLNGSVYTGCDMNTTLDDMEYLHSHSPYILAALGSTIDPNVATAFGVFGSIRSVCGGMLYGKRFLVHGTGNVGATVAELLRNAGGEVYTYDIMPERADISGCHNISHQANWWNQPCDVFVPCSKSGLVTPAIAAALPCEWVVGSANIPFSSTEVPRVLANRGIAYVPEAISSAGAILCDSVEHYNRDIFYHVAPDDMYAFVQHLVEEKTSKFAEVLFAEGGGETRAMLKVFSDVRQPACGTRFQEWEEMYAVPVSIK